MANNKIQIKRTSVTGRLPNTTSTGNGSYIAAGELALNLTDGIMYSSNGSTIIPIGANNVNVNVTGNLTVSSVVANGSLGTSGQILKSNGSATYWGTDSVDVGAANQILYRNSSNVLTTSSGLQYDGTSLKVNGNLESVYQNGSEGGEIFLSKPASNTTLSGTGVTIDIFENKIRFFENGGAVRGAYIDLTGTSSGVGTNLLSGGGGSGSVNTSAQFTWTNTHIFQANVAFNGNNITVVSNTGSVMFAGVGDTNWRIGRSTGSFNKSFYTNNTLDFIAANSNLEGIAFGFTGNSVYLETGYAGTFTQLPIYVGNSTVNVSINSTTFSGTSNNATYLNGTAAASFVQNTDSRTLSGNLVFSGANTTFSGTKVSVTGQLSAADVTISGNLIVTGTTTSINTTALDITDKNITLAKGSTSGSVANGAGFTIDGALATFVYDDSQEAFLSSLPIRIGTGVTNSSLTSTSFSGTSNNATYLGGTAAAKYVQNTDSRTLSGNLVFSGANVSFTGNTRIASLIANGSIGTAGQVLASNGTAVYWTSDQGANAITANSLTANAIAITSGTLTVGNSTVNTDIGNNYVSVGNSSSYVNVYSSYIYFGNTTANATINSTIYTGAANNASYLGGSLAAVYVKNTDSRTLSGNLVFSAANVAVTGNIRINGLIANGGLGTAGQILATNGTVVYWTSDQGANAVTANTLSANYVTVTTGTITVGNSTVNTDIGNNYVSVGNSTSYGNLYSSYLRIGNSTVYSTINSTSFTGTANDALYLGGTIASQYLKFNTSGAVSGNLSFSGTGLNVTQGGNLAITLTGALSLEAGSKLYVNNSLGTAGQVLTTDGGNTYWSTVSGGGGGFTNGQSISVNNFVITGAFTANSSNGTSGQVLTTNGSAVYWSTVTGGANATTQSFTGNGTNTVFTLAQSISDQKNILITLDGLVQIPVTHYSISGTTLTFTDAPISNTVIEARTLSGGSGGGGGGSGASANLVFGYTILFGG